MATIRKRKRKGGRTAYQVQVRLKGIEANATFATRKPAETWARITEAAIAENRYSLVQEEERHTVGDLLERYVQSSIDHLSKKEQHHRIAQLQWWGEFLGPSTVLVELTSPRIVEGRDELKEGRAPATVNRYLASLSHACGVAAREWLWLRENPAHRVRRLREPTERVRFLDRDELERLRKACARSCDEAQKRKRRASQRGLKTNAEKRERYDDRLPALLELAVSTGARAGALMRLQWQDLDQARGLAFLMKTKNGERRAVTPSDEAFRLLAERRKVRRIDSDLIFVGRKGGDAFPAEAWRAAVATAKLEDFRFHDLRHTFASNLAMTGASLLEIAAALGHKTLAMVKRYAHLTEPHQAEVVRKMHRAMLG